MNNRLQTLDVLPTTSPYGDGRVINPLPGNVVDWVYIELRQTPDGEIVVGRSALVATDGKIVDDDGSPIVNIVYPTSGYYYVLVKHRNHLSIMSHDAISLSMESPSSYDFTIAQMQCYGEDPMNNLGSGKYGLVGGDAAAVFGIVDTEDWTAMWNDRNKTGYLRTDVNLDAIVDADDRALGWNNRIRWSQVPGNSILLKVEQLAAKASEDRVSSAWAIRHQVMSGPADAWRFSFDIFVSFSGVAEDFKLSGHSLRISYNGAKLTNPRVPMGISAFYKEISPGHIEQWDTMGYFHVTETSADDASIISIDLDMTLLEGEYAAQGYTSSLLPLRSEDSEQLLCRVEFDIRNSGAFTAADGGVAWDDAANGDGHFRSSVARKKADEDAESITGGATFVMEAGDVTPTPTETPIVTSTPSPTGGSTPVIPTATPTPEVTIEITPSLVVTPTPQPSLDVAVDVLKAGVDFVMSVRLNENIKRAFDFYLFAACGGKYYTISMNGNVLPGIQALFRNVPGYAAPVFAPIRSQGVVPGEMAGMTVSLYAVVVEEGRIPPISSVSELGPRSGHVVMFDREDAVIN